MKISRIDLADSGSPEKLVGEILKIESGLSAPIPIEDLCSALDIDEIAELTTEGFEGALVTDEAKSSGIILVRAHVHEFRRRFSIAHELGHFLMPSHIPRDGGRFLCSREDMTFLAAKESNRREKMEYEANRFAATLLMPPPIFRPDADHSGDPNIARIIDLSRKYKVSKEALSRWYINFRAEPCAVVIGKGNKIVRHYRSRAFPFIEPTWGSDLPASVLTKLSRLKQNEPSSISYVDPSNWLSTNIGEITAPLFEQIELQREGYLLVLLHQKDVDEDEQYEESEIRRRWAAPRFRK